MTARLGARLMYWIRLGHLYVGLFFIPWVLLYGVTGFLFNHPTAFADVATTSFGRGVLEDTPMQSPTPPAHVAAAVVAALNARAEPGTSYALVEPHRAGYTREFAFATVSSDGRTTSILIDVGGHGGTVRAQPPRREPTTSRKEAPVRLDDPLHERVKAAVPVVLERTGFPTGDVTVTSVPDLAFLMSDAEGTTWRTTYNAMSGSVSGSPAADQTTEPLGVRRYLTRLHLASGYPPAGGARWAWAVLVDVLSGVMIFWAASGLLMWWQLKATRRLGYLMILLSLATASALAVGMWVVIESP